MTKVVFGREIVPFDTEEEWEKFWERESGRPSRHIRAQDSWNTYNTALQEIKNGKKETHWMWFIFPQMRGLGHSAYSNYYGIVNYLEAKNYLDHPILGARLRKVTEALFAVDGKTAVEILGELDAMKVRSSMTLFDAVCPNDIFRRVLEKYYDNVPDAKTLGMLGMGQIGYGNKDGIIGAIIGDIVVSSFFSSVGIFESQEYDAEMIESAKAAIEQVGITALSDKPLCEMSTGELRKTLIARALALRPEALLLDEPTVGLDIGAQIEFLDTVGGLSKDKTVIIITHHIEEIIPQIKKVLLLKDGTVFRYGTKQEVLTGENLSEAFGVSIEVGLDGDRYHIKRICG
jgi:uncharacterized protein (DUF1810 family)